jgi:hypothetical protein
MTSSGQTARAGRWAPWKSSANVNWPDWLIMVNHSTAGGFCRSNLARQETPVFLITELETGPSNEHRIAQHHQVIGFVITTTFFST